MSLLRLLPFFYNTLFVSGWIFAGMVYFSFTQSRAVTCEWDSWL